MLKRSKPALIMLGDLCRKHRVGRLSKEFTICLDKDYGIAAAAGGVTRKFLNALKSIHLENNFFSPELILITGERF